MIASLSGILRSRSPTQIVLDVAGIGFELTVPLSTSRVLAETVTEASLHIQSVFTRDGLFLYGFATREEKDVFNRLTDVKGIGPKAALNLLSRFTPAEIVAILTEEKIETLKTVPGIGPKKAAMILGQARATAPPQLVADPKLEAAVSALVSLGLTRSEAVKRLEQIPDRDKLPLNEVLTRALRTGHGE